MQKFSLVAMGRRQLERAAESRGGHAAETVVGGHERILRQTVIGLRKGAEQTDHEVNGEATIYVLEGRVRLIAGKDSWEGSTGDLLAVPDERHRVEALQDSTFLLTVAMPR
ncbi:LuxR family transcriptional regulator [Sphaerisporangium fuscum]|uniref:LuxR family transcriptional regulator n=1 Tax=Sphaerisporangium fuscum TaxID=2835868 RepID=UPI001BDD9483|nr:LuxR family transcriptional regulator [Sphaerisporangium fuscum]